jgi:hypothetical protein
MGSEEVDPSGISTLREVEKLHRKRRLDGGTLLVDPPGERATFQ